MAASMVSQIWVVRPSVVVVFDMNDNAVSIHAGR